MPDEQQHTPHYTAPEVAEWMVQQIAEAGYLYQSHAVKEIRCRFGEPFLYRNQNGNPAIDKRVMKLFNERTIKDVVWVRRDFLWRRRRPTDKPSRQQ
jgi:hypothetical protein